MARALSDIITELESVYRPQRDLYNQRLSAQDPEMEAQLKGLQAQKEDSFQQITNQANRRGMFYSGLPIAEEQKYVGQQYLPAVAGLQTKYKVAKDSLQESLLKLAQDQSFRAQDIRNTELDREEKQRQFDAELAAQREAASRASAGSGGGYQPSGYSAAGGGRVLGAQQSLRQRWQSEANRGDWNAQVALNYAGDDGRYDGAVNSLSEYNILKKMGIGGNYYVRGGNQAGSGWSVKAPVKTGAVNPGRPTVLNPLGV